MPRASSPDFGEWENCQGFVPGDDLELEVTALLDDQEHTHSFRYWEGAVSVRGARAGRAVGGSGYVELVGYEGTEDAR